jgi:hypothetical protein
MMGDRLGGGRIESHPGTGHSTGGMHGLVLRKIGSIGKTRAGIGWAAVSGASKWRQDVEGGAG